MRIVPLGGLGEIGMNCLAIEQSDGILVVDAGTAFPHDDLGIDDGHELGRSFCYWVRQRVAGRPVFVTPR